MRKQAIVLAADHAGFKLKEQLKVWLAREGYAAHDCSPQYLPNDDYPAHAAAASRAVEAIPQARVLLVCGSGAGIAMAANRFPWMRVVQATDAKVTAMSRADEDANGLALAARRLTLDQAKRLVKVFLATPANRASRHSRRQAQLADLG